jgi:putative membrane protein
VLARALAQWGLSALAFGITSWLLPGMSVSGGLFAYLWVSFLFGAVNAVVGTVLRIVTLPFIVLTLGLLLVVVNAVVLDVTDGLTNHLDIDHFWWTAIWATLILSFVSLIFNFLIWLARH